MSECNCNCNTSDYKLYISNEKGVDIQEGMYGLFFEDINYAADGGLYAELIENRSFEAVKNVGGASTEFDGCFAWSEYPKGSGLLEIESEDGLNENNPHYLKFTALENNGGFANQAYDGIYAEKGMKLNVSFYAKSDSYNGSVTVSIRKDDNIYASAEVKCNSENNNTAEQITYNWKKFSTVMTVSDTVEAADFVVSLSERGTVCFDMVSAFPDNAVLGLFRKDLAEKLKALNPGFLRFPGGCVVEGYNLSNRYQWKDTVGPIEQRKHNWNRWSAHTDLGLDDGYKHYNQTYGLGFYEYFILCEYLGAKPLPVLSCGLGCQYQGKDALDTDSEELQNYIKDAVDLIEFANGEVTTKWGSVRASMGHPKPFNLKLFGIGNEQWETEDNDFHGKYEAFERAIHKAYREIELVGTAGPKVNDEAYDTAWKWIREKVKSIPSFVSVVDEHYYMTPEWFFENDGFYDDYPRDIKIFAGEYASRAEGENKPNYPQANKLSSAISTAAFMTGLERNADVVYMASYAPLFARVNYTQWSPDMIWFDGKSSYVTPDYYTQYMYSNNCGSYTLKARTENLRDSSCRLYYSVSYDIRVKDIIIKLVNSMPTSKTVQIDASVFDIERMADVTVLFGDDLEAYNDIDNPYRVKPNEFKLEIDLNNSENGFVYMMPGNSFSVIRVHTK